MVVPGYGAGNDRCMFPLLALSTERHLHAVRPLPTGRQARLRLQTFEK